MRREAIFFANDGVCHLCERRIRPGELWDASHDRPLALLGEDGGDNLKVAHRACHATQTVADLGRISKAKRQSARHLGIKKAGKGWGDRRFKRKVSGETVLR